MRTVVFCTAMIAGFVCIGIAPGNAVPSMSGIGKTNIQAATSRTLATGGVITGDMGIRCPYYPPAYGNYVPHAAFGYAPPPGGDYVDAAPAEADYGNAPPPESEYNDEGNYDAAPPPEGDYATAPPPQGY